MPAAPGVVQTSEGPAFKINVGIQVLLKTLLEQSTNEAIGLMIKECEAVLSKRGEKYR